MGRHVSWDGGFGSMDSQDVRGDTVTFSLDITFNHIKLGQ